MEETLQHQETTQCFGLPPTSSGNHRPDGNQDGHALTFKLDHSTGADQSNENKRKDFLRGVLDKIVVKSEYGYGRDKTKKIQRGHTLDFHYKLEVVDDGFEWTDKTTSPWVSRTTDGGQVDQSPMVRLVSPRKKKVRD